MDVQRLVDQLIRLEGDRLAMYRDAAGNLIVSGRYVKSGESRDRPTVLEEDVQAVADELEDRWPIVTRLDSVRQRVVTHLAFNMEVSGLLAMKRFVSAVEVADWVTAADEMLISQWAKQAAGRAAVLAMMMRTGQDQAADRQSGNA